LVWSCRVVSKFHYTDPQTLFATRPDPRTKYVHVEIEKSLRPVKVRGLCWRPGRRPGSPTKSGRARLVEFGHYITLHCCVSVQLCRLVLHRHYDGNVIFDVTSSRPSQSTALDYQVAKYSRSHKNTRTNVHVV